METRFTQLKGYGYNLVSEGNSAAAMSSTYQPLETHAKELAGEGISTHQGQPS